MNVTPTNKQYEAMVKLTDAVCGEDPGKSKGVNASAVREKRQLMMNFLHAFCAISMREGAARRDAEVQGKARERAIRQQLGIQH